MHTDLHVTCVISIWF